MATTFITLVNEVRRRLNEVDLTTADFLTVRGFDAQVKDAVNFSIQEIGQEQFQFPFNHVTATIVTSTGTSLYSFPADMKTADFDSFRIRKSTADSINASRLKELRYEQYIRKFYERDENGGTSSYTTPDFVYRTLDTRLGVTPIPDQAYTIEYEYFKYQDELVNATDVMSIPDGFKNVVIDGAMYHCYMFRDNSQQAAIARQRYEKGIENMRKLLINRYTQVTDTRVSRVVNPPVGSG